VVANPLTLSEYLENGEQRRVLVEHARCGNSLGVHITWPDENGIVNLIKSDKDRYRNDLRRVPLQDRGRGYKGRLTAPGISYWKYRKKQGEYFARAWCPCLPDSHIDKRRPDRVGSLPVTFPDWKWGRPIDLPVVVF
jgi:hypothetical protein